MIKLSNLTKNYGKRCIFSNFSYSFPKKGLVAIVGESGSGKSTLLNIISGLDFDYTGEALVNNKNLKKFSNDNLCDFRIKNIGYVFQNFNLLNLDTIENNVLLPFDAISKAPKVIKKRRVKDALELVGLNGYLKQRINKLSGGEKQRVAVARAIINNPSIILCDEPTGALDEKNGNDLFLLLKKISQKSLVIIATHDVQAINQIADIILTIKDEKILVSELNNKIDISPVLMGRGKERTKPKISSKFKFAHSFNKIKAKKYRSIIVNLMLSLSLTGVGLSIIITDSVSQKINDAFKTIMNGNQVILSLKNDNENSFTTCYSAPYQKVAKVYEKYKYQLDGIGVNYLVNYEDFFKNCNEFSVISENKKIPLASYSTRTINDFKILKSDDEIIYPNNVELMDDDELILGLTYEDMVNLCFQLKIQRNYTSLGHYIYEKELFVVLNVKNNSWEYDDEQIFRVVGVKETSKPYFYHTNQLWNEIVFEEMMRLPSDDDDQHSFPWEMSKIYFLRTKANPSLFLETVAYDDEMYDFVFERSNYQYNPLLCKVNDVCQENMVYVYLADKNAVDLNVISKINEAIPKAKNYIITSDYGYASYASNLFSGFSKNIFVSLNKELVEDAIDADTQLNNETNISINLPDGVVQGNFLNSMAGGLKFSSKYSSLLYGRPPQNLNEIVISKGLGGLLDKKTLGLGKYLEIAGEISEFQDKNGNLHKEYSIAESVIVGIVDEDKSFVYHKPDWTISFFRDKLGVSSFNLIPKSIVFEFDSEKDAEEAFNVLSRNVSNYKITNPLDDLKVNIDSTLEYANTILICFSVLATLISILLLSTVLMLNITESKEEIKLFKYIGFKRSDINSVFTNQAVVQGLISFVISAVELICVDFVMSYILGDYLNIGFQFSLNFKPILIVFLIAIILPFLISKIMLLYLGRTKM